MNYLIKKEDWQVIFSILKLRKDVRICSEEKIRLFIEGVYCAMRSGCQWRLLPEKYGKWQSIYKRFKRWSDKNVWLNLFENVMNDMNFGKVMIDGTIIRANACAAGYEKNSQNKEALGRSCGGFSTKIHALTDSNGKPIKFILSPGQNHEITKASELIKDINNALILADKAFDSDDLIKFIEEKNCIPIIPSKTNRVKPRELDKNIYKERNLIERFFGKIKYFRRIFSRFDKSANVFLSFLYLYG